MKHVPLKEEKEYLALDAQIKNLEKQRARYKAQFAAYYEKGYCFTLLTPTAPEKFSPPWKNLCMELLAQFMTPPQRKSWMRKLIIRFPRKPTAPSFRPRATEKVEA